MHPPLNVTVAQILTRLLSEPPLILADHLGAWIRDAAEPRARLAPLASSASASADVMPWEEPIYSVANGVALVRVFGPLVKGYDDFTCWCYGLMSMDRLQSAVHEIAARMDVSSVVFHFNSPGGMTQGTPETAALIAHLGDSKLTLAFTDALCCSAAYWMASECRLVFATPSASVGSIGTYLAFYDWTEYLTKAGIKLELFARGTYKAMGIAGKPLTDEQRALLDARIDKINGKFLAAVRAARPGVKDETMQGQTFDGEEGVEAKLVDHTVGGLHDLVAQLVRAA